MLLRAIVVRHGHAPSLSPPASDRDRQLDGRGRRESEWLGAAIEAMAWRPDLALSSDAPRALETWHRMERGFSGRVPLLVDHGFYGGGAETAAQSLAALPHTVSTALIVGHNPAWEYLVRWWTGHVVPFGTANAALLEGEAPDWRMWLGAGSARLVDVLRPPEAVARSVTGHSG